MKRGDPSSAGLVREELVPLGSCRHLDLQCPRPCCLTDLVEHTNYDDESHQAQVQRVADPNRILDLR
jgi:hypothetical protein